MSCCSKTVNTVLVSIVWLVALALSEPLSCPKDLACRCSVEHYDGNDALNVDCRNTDLHSVPISLLDVLGDLPVVSLDFSSNRITSISDNIFRGLHFERIYWGHDPKLIFDNNPITVISPNAFIGITGERLTITFENCTLGLLPKKQLAVITNLTGLNLNGNSINAIQSGEFGPFQRLEKLLISNNPLINLEDDIFDGLQDVLQMVFADNIGLDIFPKYTFMDLSQLKLISLSYNKITSLPSKMFQDYASKYDALSLNLYDNKITSIAEDAFINANTGLKVYMLQLQKNQISDLNFLANPCSKVIRDDKYMTATQVFLQENPIHCDCGLYDIARTGMYFLYGTCANPAAYAGKNIHVIGDWDHGTFKEEFGFLAKRNCAKNDQQEFPWDISCKEWRDRQYKHNTSKGSQCNHLSLYCLLLVFHFLSLLCSNP